MEGLKQKILAHKCKIAVVGLGYVGLPLALAFAKKGFHVKGIEIDKDRLSHIHNRESYITDISSQELTQVIKSGRFSATGDFHALADTEVIIICVPTPLKRKYTPNISYIKQAVKAIAANLKPGSLVILESTTYPGTTEEEILPLLEGRALKHNRDFFLSFSPERIDPGNKAYPVDKIPKVVGGVSKEATDLAASLYKSIIDEVVPVSTARAAEAVKLLENTFRLINIALVDELAMMAHKMKIDIWEVIRAASTKPFGFMPFYPGPGVGGHCIPKDPLYLYWKAKHFGCNLRFVKLASMITNYMPEYIVTRLDEILRVKNKGLEKARILIVGVTYKKDIKDLRKSPGIDIINILQRKAVKVSYLDPLILYLKINNINLKSIKMTQSTLKKFDCVVIATDHSTLDYEAILKYSQLIFDTRNVFKGVNNRKVFVL